MPNFTIDGDVSDGFEPVRRRFAARFTDGAEDGGAGIVVFVGDDKVVDLMGNVDGFEYNRDSLHLIYSSSKTLESICMAMLVDRGLLSYHDRVSKHWPEFGQMGKEIIKISEVMSGRTMGEFIRDELRGRLGLDVHLGLEPEDENRLTKIGLRSPTKVYYDALLGRPSVPPLSHLFKTSFQMVLGYIELMKRVGRDSLQELWHFFNVPFRTTAFVTSKPGLLQRLGSMATAMDHERTLALARAEVPSAGVCASTTALARIASAMANGGGDIVGREAWEQMHKYGKVDNDLYFGGIRTEFTQGGINRFRDYQDDVWIEKCFKTGRDGWFGWCGMGGSVMQWHPELKIGFACLSTQLAWYDMLFESTGEMQQLVVDCVRKLKDSRGSD